MEMREECPTCRGQGMTITCEVNDQYDRTHLSWDTCRTCGGEGSVEVEERDDEI